MKAKRFSFSFFLFDFPPGLPFRLYSFLAFRRESALSTPPKGRPKTPPGLSIGLLDASKGPPPPPPPPRRKREREDGLRDFALFFVQLETTQPPFLCVCVCSRVKKSDFKSGRRRAGAFVFREGRRRKVKGVSGVKTTTTTTHHHHVHSRAQTSRSRFQATAIGPTDWDFWRADGVEYHALARGHVRARRHAVGRRHV